MVLGQQLKDAAVSALPVCVCMPQLAADVPVQQSKFAALEEEGVCSSRGACLCDCCRGQVAPHPHFTDTRRFSSPGLLRPHVPLPGGGWHDFGTMSDSSLWTVLSNFTMPHFLSRARLRRSKR